MKNWKSAFEPRNEIIVVSVKKDNTPYAIYALSMGITDQKLVIGVCLMKTTIENIKNNSAVVIMGKSADGYFRLHGVARIETSGKYLDIANTHSKPPLPHSALVIDIADIYDVETGERIA
jgi:hypothetical protein